MRRCVQGRIQARVFFAGSSIQQQIFATCKQVRKSSLNANSCKTFSLDATWSSKGLLDAVRSNLPTLTTQNHGNQNFAYNLIAVLGLQVRHGSYKVLCERRTNNWVRMQIILREPFLLSFAYDLSYDNDGMVKASILENINFDFSLHETKIDYVHFETKSQN